jgi:hypothetical protein
MSGPLDLGRAISDWALRTRSVSGLIAFGSRERAADCNVKWADAFSDWDFQVITDDVPMFFNAAWTREVCGVSVRAYGLRLAQIGAVPKVNIVFDVGEVDLVIIPGRSARILKACVGLGLHKRSTRVYRRLQELAEVIRPGWRLVKGEEKWGNVLRRIVSEVADPSLDDLEITRLANCLYCDYTWCLRKLHRGELRAMQRILYRDIWETNLQLLYELKRRKGAQSFTKARRLETTCTEGELTSVSISPALELADLRGALEKSAATCRSLMEGLLGDHWRWPE